MHKKVAKNAARSCKVSFLRCVCGVYKSKKLQKHQKSLFCTFWWLGTSFILGGGGGVNGRDRAPPPAEVLGLPPAVVDGLYGAPLPAVVDGQDGPPPAVVDG